MRRQLVDQIRREVGELVLELELDSRGQKRRPFEQSADRRVEFVLEQSAEPLGDPRIVPCKLGRLFAQDRELLIVELEEFAVHRLSGHSLMGANSSWFFVH